MPDDGYRSGASTTATHLAERIADFIQTFNIFCDRHRSGAPLKRMMETRGGQISVWHAWIRQASLVGALEGSKHAFVCCYLGYVTVFFARCCLGQVPGGAPFSQRSELATACTNRMQIKLGTVKTN